MSFPDQGWMYSDTVTSTGLPLSTYFSAIKLRWMIDHYPDVTAAHEADDLLFGTVESWVAYVSQYSIVLCPLPCSTLMVVNFSFPIVILISVVPPT